MLSSQKIHCGIIKILKFNFLTQNFSLSLCCRAAGDVKHTKNFSLSLSLSSLCCVIYYPRGRSSVHSSKRVTTGPNGLQHNGLERVPSQRVPTGLTGGRRKGQWHVYYLPTIILFISFIQKNFISLFIFLLSLCNNPRKYL